MAFIFAKFDIKIKNTSTYCGTLYVKYGLCKIPAGNTAIK